MIIKISNKSLKQRFNCSERFITNVCKGSCCRKSSGGTLITIHPSEEERFSAKGIEIKDHKIVCGGRCPFQKDNGLCELHLTNEKPFGCVASPFTLNDRGTLIIRNRYRLMRCYNATGAKPAFITFRAGLEIIFGKEKTDYIVGTVQNTGDDFYMEIDDKIFNILRENDVYKQDNKDR